MFSFAGGRFIIPDNVRQMCADTWDGIARPGTSWTAVERLAIAERARAERLGMVAGETSEFVEIDQWKLAQQIAAGGVLDDSARLIVIDTDPLEQHSDVKRVSAGQP